MTQQGPCHILKEAVKNRQLVCSRDATVKKTEVRNNWQNPAKPSWAFQRILTMPGKTIAMKFVFASAVKTDQSRIMWPLLNFSCLLRKMQAQFVRNYFDFKRHCHKIMTFSNWNIMCLRFKHTELFQFAVASVECEKVCGELPCFFQFSCLYSLFNRRSPQNWHNCYSEEAIIQTEQSCTLC